ncbi:hypothetical protein [Billgrantia montanilacus]|uniref:hypothetical protein n=1 Tax=Billgrantia montanilacus TaxID=2282305 RepID=UPI0015F11381|nr:hypothetical protein [Halomonas montanilacus]
MNTTSTKPNNSAVLATPSDDREKLARMEKADPRLTPLLVEIIAKFMRSKPLPK